jgi:two-component system response regulator FlrC
MGKFEQAQGGTLLLDEISEMDLALQAKLLRVLQEREIERLGGKKLIPLDVRVLATTNRDLPDAVRQGRFREDLFYRLNVFPLTIAPLRERLRDILPLAAWSLGKGLPGGGCRAAPELSATAREALLAHAWPGNVRELDNLMQRVLVMHKGGPIQAGDLGLTATGRDAPVRHAQPLTQDADGLGEKLRQEERELILAALAAERGSRKQAAARLGISPRTLRYKLAQIREAGVAIAV